MSNTLNGIDKVNMEMSSDCNKPLLLVFPYNVMAHYLRCLQLAWFLKPYYHIKFVYSPQYCSFVRDAGFETFKCSALDADKVQQCVELFDFSWLNQKDLSRIYFDQVEVIEQLNASAVLGDMAPTLKMAAEKTGVPYYSLLNGYLTKYYGYVRRMPKSYPLYKLFNLLPSSLFTYFTNVGEHLYFQDIHKPFSKIRKREGLQVKYSYMQELEGDLNLVCDLPELFPQKNLPSNYYFVPPLFKPGSDDNNEITSKLDPAKKTIYVSMGSTGSWKKVTFLNNPFFRQYNIVTAGDIEGIIKGDNIFSYSFVSSSKLFALVDLVICHGGNGTTNQALSYGIPVLCKTSHLEQEYNIDGLERLNFGKSLDEFSDDREYELIIEEWLQKKNNKDLVYLKSKIAEANRGFEKTIRNVVLPYIEPAL